MQALTYWIIYPENTMGLHLLYDTTPDSVHLTILACLINPEWGWPVMTWDPYCTPPLVTSIARLEELRKHQGNSCRSCTVRHPGTYFLRFFV